MQALSKVGSAMYWPASPDGGQDGFTGANAEEPTSDDEATVEGEFREVGSDK